MLLFFLFNVFAWSIVYMSVSLLVCFFLKFACLIPLLAKFAYFLLACLIKLYLFAGSIVSLSLSWLNNLSNQSLIQRTIK